jgi:hypothetical protein
MTLNRAVCFIAFLICNVATVSAQLPLGFGLKGGFAITDAFSPGGEPPNLFSQSATKDYIIGPAVDLRLPLGLGLEADALYRPASLEIQSVVVSNPTTNPTFSTTPFLKRHVNAVEFPVLVKYRISFFRFKPVVEAGPSFRAGGNNFDLTHSGFTVGGGLESKIPVVRLSTDLRYTRWRGSSSTVEATPNNNQLEVLFGFSF